MLYFLKNPTVNHLVRHDRIFPEQMNLFTFSSPRQHLEPGASPGFFRGRGGVTLCQNEVTQQIVMSFSPPVVGFLLKIWLTKGWGVTGTPGPPPPGPTPCLEPRDGHEYPEKRRKLMQWFPMVSHNKFIRHTGYYVKYRYF